jgi:hypothetical protein
VLRRSLPIAAIAAAVVTLVPGTAAATPEPAPVDNMFSASYSAEVQLVMPDGRHARLSLVEGRGASQDGWQGQLSINLWSETPCWGYICQSGWTSGYTELTDAQVDFDRSLASASATDIPVTLVSWEYSPETGMIEHEEQIMVSAAFTGTGPVDRATYRGDTCIDGVRECESIRVDSYRTATATLTVGDQVAKGAGSLHYGHGVDAAAATYTGEYGY